mmetsp:Transcript_39105/g.87007  ORF Transcript_39105/g.87007 Transcript_39105/m.87007 type:complete len:225 (+) Transcript_39105:468-1142(+)
MGGFPQRPFVRVVQSPPQGPDLGLLDPGGSARTSPFGSSSSSPRRSWPSGPPLQPTTTTATSARQRRTPPQMLSQQGRVFHSTTIQEQQQHQQQQRVSAARLRLAQPSPELTAVSPPPQQHQQQHQGGPLPPPAPRRNQASSAAAALPQLQPTVSRVSLKSYSPEAAGSAPRSGPAAPSLQQRLGGPQQPSGPPVSGEVQLVHLVLPALPVPHRAGSPPRHATR